ncbi:MAG: hypothetical protein AB7V58_05575 [Solirubrobacterales bacterium]
MSRSRFAAVLTALILLALAAPALSSAESSQLVVNTVTPELEEADSGDGSKLELEFTNITDGPAILTVAAIGQRGCNPTLSENQLPPNRTTGVEVEIPSPCDRSDDVLKLKLTAELAAGASQVFLIEPEGSGADKPDWKVLFGFPVLLLLSLALAVWFLFKGWKPQTAVPRKKRKEGEPDEQSPGLWDRLRQPLTEIDVSTWKFNDNWATNVTAAGALLTGLFGATTAKAFLGEDAESLTALATVGAAITAAFVGAAPIAVLATKSYATYEKKRGDFFTVGGVLLGAAVVTAAAIGQLGIIAYTATELSIGIVAKLVIGIGFALAAALILVYARRSLRDVLEDGTEKSAADPEVEMEAAAVIAKELKAIRKEIALASAPAPRREMLKEPEPGEAEKPEVREEVPPASPVRARRARSALL